MAEILREIGMIARALDSIANIEFKEYDLTRGQYLYLIRICENPGIIQEKLADMIKVDRTTASRAIKKLEASGFIEKKADAANRKIKRIFPTEKGKAISQTSARKTSTRNGWRCRVYPKMNQRFSSICSKRSGKTSKATGNT